MSDVMNEKEAPIFAMLTYSSGQEKTFRWQEFPTTQEKMEQNLGSAGIALDQIPHFSSAEYSSYVHWLDSRLPSQPDLSELNYLAARINGMSYEELLTFEAVMEMNLHCESVADMINLTHNLHLFELYPGFHSEKDMGEALLDMHSDAHAMELYLLHGSDKPEEKAFAEYIERLENSVDPEKYFALTREAEGGHLVSEGYLVPHAGDLPVKYAGLQDIPAEYRLDVQPKEPERKPSLLGRLAEIKEQMIADAAARKDKPTPEKKPPSGPEL